MAQEPNQIAAFRDALTGPFAEQMWHRLLSENCHLRIANRLPVVSRKACVAELSELYRAIRAIGCDYWDCHVAGTVWYIESDIALGQHGMMVSRSPCALVVRTRAGSIMDFRIYGAINAPGFT